MAQEDSTNYSFLLKCLAAVTAAALFIAGIIAAASLNAGTTGSFMLASSAAAFAPIIPIALACIGLVCLLTFLCSDNSNTTVHMGGAYPRGGSFFSNGYFRNPYAGIYGNPASNMHNNPASNMHNNPASNMHNNPASNMHNNPASNMHNNPASNMRGNPAPNLYGNPASNLRGNPAPNLYSNPASNTHNRH